MQHISVPLFNEGVELIEISPCEFSPLISKCQIKVCYVSDKPNRNKSIITKETARKLAPSLRGAAIVGYYNENEKDYEEHNRDVRFKDGQLEITDATRPYGFVDLSAKVWFQKFMDDGTNVREYLMTEGYLWTESYPEARRILEQGNNQSMELSEKYLDGSWTKDANGKPQFFVINEAIIEKLCILGEDWEPCFEGATIGKPIIQFSLDDGFKDELKSMISEIKDYIKEGGKIPMSENKEIILDNGTEEILDNPVQTEVAEIEEPLNDFAKKDDEEDKDEEKVCPKCGKPESECTCEDEDEEEDDKKKKYTLEEIPEYIELLDKFSALQASYEELNANAKVLQENLDTLTAFKAQVEKQEKQNMIDGFYMLSDEDKKDVVENIDSYSLDEIEAKLSIICVRNKVSFNLNDEDEKKVEEPITYSFVGGEEDNSPEWIKSVRSVAQDIK